MTSTYSSEWNVVRVFSSACSPCDSANILSFDIGQKYDAKHFVIKAVFADDLVSHGNSQWFHGVINCVVVGADHVIEVVDSVKILFSLKHFVNIMEQ